MAFTVDLAILAIFVLISLYLIYSEDENSIANILAGEEFMEITSNTEMSSSRRETEKRKQNAENNAPGRRCTVSLCINAQRCKFNPQRRLTVGLQPILQFETAEFSLSPEYVELRRFIRKSRHFVANESIACVILPGFDTFQSFRDVDAAEHLLTVARQNDRSSAATNFLIFNFLAQNALKSFAAPAISASAEFRRPYYRNHFDVAIPILRPYNIFLLNTTASISTFSLNGVTEKHDLISSSIANAKIAHLQLRIGVFVKRIQWNLSADQVISDVDSDISTIISQLKSFADRMSVTLLTECQMTKNENDPFAVCDEHGTKIDYFAVVTDMFDIVMIVDEVVAFEAILMDVLQGGYAIPAILSDSYVPPFSEVIDWRRFSFLFTKSFALSAPAFFAEINAEKLSSMRAQANLMYTKYFSSMHTVLTTVFEILEARIVSGAQVRSWDDWNLVPPSNQFMPTNVKNVVKFVANASHTRVHLIIFFVRRVTNAFRAHVACVKIVNSLIDSLNFGESGFELARLTVVLHIDNKRDTVEHTPHLDGVHRTQTPISINVVEVNLPSELQRFWTSEYFNGLDDKENNVMVVNGDAIQETHALWEQDYVEFAFKLWRDVALSTVILRAENSSSLSHTQFPSFEFATLYETQRLRRHLQTIFASKGSPNKREYSQIFNENTCKSVSICKDTTQNATTNSHYHFTICH